MVGMSLNSTGRLFFSQRKLAPLEAQQQIYQHNCSDGREIHMHSIKPCDFQ